MTIQLVTFGGLRAVGDDGELDGLLSQRSRAALLVYLAIEQRVSRESLTALFWPESDAENARHALRQSLYQLRRIVGGDWIASRAHELVVTGEVRTDAQDFSLAIERGDLGAAVELYRGPFLEGVHLADLAGWETWVDGRRAHYARAFRRACRDLIDAHRASGNLRGAIEVAESWTVRDALDGEAQHRLIESLAAAGERAEAIRQFEAYERSLQADALAPLDETVQLVDRLRREASPLPPSGAIVAPTERIESGYPPAIEKQPTHRGTRRKLAIAAIASAVIVPGLWWGFGRARVAPPTSVTAVAVLPFSVRGSPSAAYLGDGVVNLLSAALDGAGSLRPVDTRAIFAAVNEGTQSARTLEEGQRVARQLDASLFVLGDVVEAAGALQIEAVVYRVGSGEPRAKVVVNGPADSVFVLVDRVAARLLGELGDPNAEGLLRTASLTTTSLAAFKEYLQGESLMRTGEFERAADAYLAALALDSTFAVAHYRLALAREWAPLPGESEAADAAARHGARLSARDRMLLEAFQKWRSGDATEAERAYRAILTRYGDDVDAWFQLGEIQFHHGPLFGRSLVESEAAWRKLRSFEPHNLFALVHLARIAVVSGRLSTLDSLLSSFTPEELRNDRRLEELAILQAVARGDTAGARQLGKHLARAEAFAVWRVAVFLASFTSDPALMRLVLDDLLKDFPTRSLAADLHWVSSLLDLAGGRMRAANASLARAMESERGAPADLRRPGFDWSTEWFAATLPLPYSDSTLRSVRERAASLEIPASAARGGFARALGIGSPIQSEPLRQLTLGTLALRLGDTAAATAAATTLERLARSSQATTLVRDLDRGLRARLARLRGRSDEALQLLESFESHDSQGDVTATPFVARGAERFLRGDLLIASGRLTEAIPWFRSLGYGSVTELPLRAPAQLRLAEIHERLGNRTEAATHYRQFLALWRDADPELRVLVDSATRRLSAITHPG